jgi:hypothetical protein
MLDDIFVSDIGVLFTLICNLEERNFRNKKLK